MYHGDTWLLDVHSSSKLCNPSCSLCVCLFVRVSWAALFRGFELQCLSSPVVLKDVFSWTNTLVLSLIYVVHGLQYHFPSLSEIPGCFASQALQSVCSSFIGVHFCQHQQGRANVFIQHLSYTKAVQSTMQTNTIRVQQCTLNPN